MPEPIIKVHDVRVVYNIGKSNEYHALRGESLDIFPGEYIILFGPSGCGKSTLLYAILGVLQPTSGELLVKGDDVYKYTPAEMVKFQQNTIGIIYQAFNLIQSLTVIDNVALPMIFANILPAERERKAMALLKRFGVERQAHKRGTDLSGGQMQRIAVARSLINDPEIVLADEPVGNLDSVSADEVMGSLMRINKEDKKTIILVTHDAKFLPYAHRTYFLKEGGVEREVVNPERHQIKSVKPGTTILTEIEKLARVYPYVTVQDLKVKSILNYLTQDLTFEQLERLEKFVIMVLDGKIEEPEFMHALTAPFAQGGAEIPPPTALIMAKKIEKILENAREIRRYRKRLQDKFASTKQNERLIQLRQNVLDEYAGEVTEEQVRWLDDNIASRVGGLLTMEDFRDRLSITREHQGGGFSVKEARSISRYLEKLVAQGVHLT
jgi:ABC-type lipoprotein export system ATPase subunit